MIVTTKLTISMLTGEVIEHEFYNYEGPVDMCCGASSQQDDTFRTQSKLFDSMVSQSQETFGASSKVFGDLYKSYAPIVAAGPGQKGFSAGEESNLKSGAITNVGQAYKHASQAVKEASAAVGGGNAYLPGGAEIGRNVEVANEGAAQTASALNKIDTANYETGRENYFKASAGLESAPSVFNAASEAGNAATGAGKAASDTANTIAQEDNSWVSAVTGMAGALGSAAITGGMSGAAKKSTNATNSTIYPSM